MYDSSISIVTSHFKIYDGSTITSHLYISVHISEVVWLIQQLKSPVWTPSVRKLGSNAMALPDHVLKVPIFTFETEIRIPIKFSNGNQPINFLDGPQAPKLLSHISSKSCLLFFARNKQYQLWGIGWNWINFTSEDIEITENCKKNVSNLN